MTEKNKISKFITFPTTFENYKWYKPILVFIVTAIMYLILNGIITLIFYAIFGQNMISSIVFGGYEVMNTEAGQIYSDLGIIIILPALYVATKVIKDRPLSSYASSRGGFNYRLYFKALLIPIIIYVIFEIINIFTVGIKGTNHFSIPFFIVCIILVPLQCISEEFAFRGLIMQSIGSWVKIPVLTIVIQAIIFAALHGYNNLGVLIIFISGLVMGFFAWKTNGIEISSAVHTINNLSSALAVMFRLEMTTSTISTTDTILGIIMEVVIFVIMYLAITKTDWFSEINEPA